MVLSRYIQRLAVEKVTMSKRVERIIQIVFFLLNSFLVKRALKRAIIKTIVSITITMENMMVVNFKRKLLISLRLIPKLAKKLTSAGVFALKTTKVRNAPPKINAINNMAHKNQNALPAEIDFFSIAFFASFCSESFAFTKRVSQCAPGTTLESTSIFFPLN